MYNAKKITIKQHCKIYEAHLKEDITSEDVQYIESYIDYSNRNNEQKKIYLNLIKMYDDGKSLNEIEIITTNKIKELMKSKDLPQKFLNLAKPFTLLLISVFLRKLIMNP